VALAGAEIFARAANEAARLRGRFAVALAGGSTPKALYRKLTELIPPIPWESVHLFWGDERCVPPDHPESNYWMARETLLAHAQIPDANVHRIRGEDPDPEAAADDYELDIRKFFALGPGETPTFDLVLLGLGHDGHVASLFPGSAALSEDRRLVAVHRLEDGPGRRITLTLRVLNAASRIVFLVSGERKASILRQVLEGAYDPRRLPAQGVQPRGGSLLWLVDDDAVSRLRAARRPGP
jgi:6-phosphogluconolactonase